MALTVISAFITFALILFIAGVRSQEVEDEKEFEYKEGPKGPENWWKLNDEWWACGNGTEQSPIDVVKSNAILSPDLGTLHRNYYPENAILVNRGHDIMVNWAEGAGSLEIQGKSFTLSQCHWHHPAEHTINGEQHPLEIHLVHQAEDNEIAVIGIIYRDGPSDPFLSQLRDAIHAIAHLEPPVKPLGPVNPNDIIFDSSRYYRYMGSLTTPACTEGVIWTVIDEIKTVSEDQVRALQAAVHDGYDKNARPIQSLNGRVVGIYSEEWTSS